MAVPKIRGYAIQLHEKMTETAIVDEADNVIWTGSVSALFRELGLDQNYHTLVMRLLKETECLRQLQKGSKNIPSVYALLRSPALLAEEEWPSVNSIVKSRAEGLTISPAGYKLLEQEIRGVAERTGLAGGLDIPKALVELANQVNQIEDKITEIERRLNAFENQKV